MTPQSVERPISMTDDETLIGRLKLAAQSSSDISRQMAEAKSLRQDGNAERRTDLYMWPKPEETTEGKAATRIEDLRQQVERLEEDSTFIHRWVERGLFCSHTTPQNALECIAHHPSAPWKNGRWDVDHKPYAMKLYAHFPKARAALTEKHNG